MAEDLCSACEALESACADFRTAVSLAAGAGVPELELGVEDSGSETVFLRVRPKGSRSDGALVRMDLDPMGARPATGGVSEKWRISVLSEDGSEEELAVGAPGPFLARLAAV